MTTVAIQQHLEMQPNAQWSDVLKKSVIFKRQLIAAGQTWLWFLSSATLSSQAGFEPRTCHKNKLKKPKVKLQITNGSFI